MKGIELFAGMGGLALGVEEAGFEHIALFESDQTACNTLRLNNSAHKWEVVQCDICEFDFRYFRDEVDIVTGGPPCQPFSQGGKHGGQSDRRNMFPQAVRVIREVRPKAFLFENVKGLLRKNFADYYSYIIQQLRYPSVRPKKCENWQDHFMRLQLTHENARYGGLSYNVSFKLVDAAQYSIGEGVPQHRERVFIVGIRSDLGRTFKFPENKTHNMEALRYDQWITGSYWDKHCVARKDRPKRPTSKYFDQLSLFDGLNMGKPCRTVRDAIHDLPKISIGKVSNDIANHFINPGARTYPGHTGSPYDEPAKTLKAGDHGVPGGENTLRYNDGSVRYFSVRECARLQTFPDDWIIEGSWTEGMRQLGNAVPVKTAQLVAESLKKCLTMDK